MPFWPGGKFTLILEVNKAELGCSPIEERIVNIGKALLLLSHFPGKVAVEEKCQYERKDEYPQRK